MLVIKEKSVCLHTKGIPSKKHNMMMKRRKRLHTKNVKIVKLLNIVLKKAAVKKDILLLKETAVAVVRVLL